ncbi:glycosyltransferase family 2 protein [Hahella sp. CR1]|uniref:glycosyltransferase family 2 protein n=1 Tax=Hahella sp. CR1 TaxID=2992807 RepID=UPI002441F7B4|nr:glycosyltransferase family 2 protein [Hahella sp. CR1]MDG9667313.1 glycosyltransferase family 2 protein [Hahella sp. CR1]
MHAKLTISIVLYNTPKSLLVELACALNIAIAVSNENVIIFLVDNSEPSPQNLEEVCSELDWGAEMVFIKASNNGGYGGGNNQLLNILESKYHLILNPDVLVDVDSIGFGLRYLEDQSDVILISPASRTPGQNDTQYLCKRYPSFLVLFLRFINSPWLNSRFSRALSEYEYRHETDSGASFSPEIVSGCFMLCRTSALKKVGGFDERFFLYFEDFDLSLRMGKVGKVVYLPEMKIQHYGGGAGRKGWKHVRMFIVSAAKFFHKHGLKWI